MQYTLLRVFVVALGLLMCPRDDPGIEEWDEILAEGMQKHEEKLLRGGEKVDHEMAPDRKEITNTDTTAPQGDIKSIYSDQHATENDKMVALQEETVMKQDHEANSDPSWSQNSESETKIALKASQINHEQNENLQLNMKNKQMEDMQTDAGGSHRHQEKPEEKNMLNSKKQESPLSHSHTTTSENETAETIADWEGDYLWYLCNTLSAISMIRFFRKYIVKKSQTKQQTRAFPVICTAAEVLLPDSDTLQRFHSKCIQSSPDKKWKDFLEGFAKDLLEAMRTVCDKDGGMMIKDFQIVDMCNIIIPITPPDPYSFKCLLWNHQASDLPPDMQVCGQIKLVENNKFQNGCNCQSPDSDDIVCLLHCETEKVKTKTIDICEVLLCMKNSPFLSKSQVTRWFLSTIKQAWEQISHKYEFELNIRYIGAPGALIVRFRSGKKISFSMNPVVKINTDAHFCITSCSLDNLDTLWTLSLTNYEDHLIEQISKLMPVNSCHRQTLEIACFLHKRQTALTGSCVLSDSHFKTALMHLLLTKNPSQWKPSYVACRLRDLLTFMERSLEKKTLHHVLIGNPLSQRVVELPAELTHAKKVNLFHPLVVHNCIYRNAVTHFQEMLRNAHLLIWDYVKCGN